MAKNFTREVFRGDTTWTCPAGVSQVRVRVVENRPPPVAVSARNSYGINAFGQVFAWGNLTGIGDATAISKSSPVMVVGSWATRSIGAGGLASFIVNGDGSLRSWGTTLTGGLGDNNTSPTASFPIATSGSRFYKMVAGLGAGIADGGFAIAANGDTYAWGLNSSGQLGDGTTLDRSSPVLVVGSKKFIKLSGGQSSVSALTWDGDIYCWGNNLKGALGDGTVAAKSSPVLVVGSRKFVDVAMGGNSSGLESGYGITTAGDMYAWGNNSAGQLGDGTIAAKSSPVLVLGSLKWASVSAGPLSVVGITTTGDMYAWGGNSNGQLGDGTVVAKSSPVLVLGGLKWSSVYQGGQSSVSVTTLGITTDGNAYAWGYNSDGQIGDNSIVPKSSPVLVVGSNTWRTTLSACLNDLVIDVVAGRSYTISIGNFSTFKFGTRSVYQTQNGEVLASMVLEYFA